MALPDAAYFGPEPEFFIFDDVRWKNDISGAFFSIDSEEAGWNSAKKYEDGNHGHRPPPRSRADTFQCRR